MKYLKIEDDVYFIASRLKMIDESYQIFYNLNKKTYEVHSGTVSKDSYCFTVPYSSLDSRVLDYALKTRSANRDKIIEEIEFNNQKLYEKSIKEQTKKIKEVLCL